MTISQLNPTYREVIAKPPAKAHKPRPRSSTGLSTAALGVSEIGKLQLSDFRPEEGRLWITRLKGSTPSRTADQNAFLTLQSGHSRSPSPWIQGSWSLRPAVLRQSDATLSVDGDACAAEFREYQCHAHNLIRSRSPPWCWPRGGSPHFGQTHFPSTYCQSTRPQRAQRSARCEVGVVREWPFGTDRQTTASTATTASTVPFPLPFNGLAEVCGGGGCAAGGDCSATSDAGPPLGPSAACD